MNKLIAAALFVVILFTSHSYAETFLFSVKNDSKIERILSKCHNAVNRIDMDIPDTIACPVVKKFKYSKTVSHDELKNIVEAEFSEFKLKDSKTFQWDSLIKDSFGIQVGWVAENLSEGSGQYSVKAEEEIRKAMRDSANAVAELSKIIKGSGQFMGSKVYFDTETVWAKNVSAKAVVIFNSGLKTVDIYLHGDLDG